jgi:hypothetical protein
MACLLALLHPATSLAQTSDAPDRFDWWTWIERAAIALPSTYVMMPANNWYMQPPFAASLGVGSGAGTGWHATARVRSLGIDIKRYRDGTDVLLVVLAGGRACVPQIAEGWLICMSHQVGVARMNGDSRFALAFPDFGIGRKMAKHLYVETNGGYVWRAQGWWWSGGLSIMVGSHPMVEELER